MNQVLIRCSLAIFLGACLVSCGGPSSRREITQTRVVESPSLAVRPGASSAERFGFTVGDSAPSTGAAESGLAWTRPEGWDLMAPRPMRVVSFQVGGSEAAECYVSLLKNDGGGVDANVNRWRAQMGAPALRGEEIAALPRLTVLGQPSVLVEVSGSQGATSGDSQLGNSLLGVVCLLDGGSVFVKMTGPEDVVREEVDRFKSFCESLR